VIQRCGLSIVDDILTEANYLREDATGTSWSALLEARGACTHDQIFPVTCRLAIADSHALLANGARLCLGAQVIHTCSKVMA
jgi:hypothetical protein